MQFLSVCQGKYLNIFESNGDLLWIGSGDAKKALLKSCKGITSLNPEHT